MNAEYRLNVNRKNEPQDRFEKDILNANFVQMTIC